MAERRGLYFSFQGLFVAVMLLIFLYHYQGISGWMERFLFLMLASAGSLMLLRLAPAGFFANWYCQIGLFLGDAALASLLLHWTKLDSELYLIYFLLIFGTAIMRSGTQSLVVALVTSGLYVISAWRPHEGLIYGSAFWLRVNFLWVSSALLALLANDSRQAQREAERKQQERLVQFERLAALGQLAGEVAHRIKGPLTTIMVNAEVLSRRGHAPRAQAELAEIRSEAGHCRDILKSLLDLGRIEEMDRVPFDLREPLRRALTAVAARVRQHKIRLEESEMTEPLPVRGDPSLVQEAVAALLHNAVDAAGDKGRIRVAARRAAGPRGQSGFFQRRPPVCEIIVEDHGRGIPAADLERVFQPFYTTKGQYGSGLGLPAALRIMHKHGGTIEAFSDGPGRGAKFILSLPRRT